MDESGGDSSFMEYSNQDVSNRQKTTSQLTKGHVEEASFQEYSNEQIAKSKSQLNTSMAKVNEIDESEQEEKKQLRSQKSAMSVKPKS
jgi:predicted transglutaminase-like cysteine proteinase